MPKIICIKTKWFVFLVTFVCLVTGYFLYNTVLYSVFHKPELNIVIRFKETPPIGQALLKEGIGLFYRGFGVGEVYKVTLSDDQNYIIFKSRIYYKDLNLPSNVIAQLRTQGVLGDKYISLSMPKNPTADKLANGDVLDGTTVVEDIGEMIVEELGKYNIKKLAFSITSLANRLNQVVSENRGNVNKFVKELASSGGEAGDILTNVKTIVGNPQVKSDIKATIGNSSLSTKRINEILNSNELKQVMTTTPQTIDETTRAVRSVNESISKATAYIPETTLSFKQAACSIDSTFKTYDCFGQGLSDMLSQKFLVFRLLFGSSGNSFQTCNKCNQYKSCQLK